jgi:transcription initiation factor TFIIIB Brf1 subunit/transcription initiation factor TFIIB
MVDLERIWADFDVLRSIEARDGLPIFRPEYECVCGGTRALNDDGLLACASCGRTDESFISDEPEWRGGPGDDGGTVGDPSRVGAPTNLSHFSEGWNTGTIIHVKRNQSYALKRMARINFHMSMNHKDRSLFHSYAEMDRVGRDILGLPTSVMSAAKIKYKQFSESVLTRGAVRTGVKANCIFQACKEAGISRTTQEIAAAFEIPVRDLARTTETFLEQNPDSRVIVTTAADIVPRFFNEVTAVPESERGRTRMKLIARCKELEDHPGLQGRTPKAIAAAVMFMMLKNYHVTKADLARICEVSVPTITKLEAIILKG